MVPYCSFATFCVAQIFAAFFAEFWTVVVLLFFRRHQHTQRHWSTHPPPTCPSPSDVRKSPPPLSPRLFGFNPPQPSPTPDPCLRSRSLAFHTPPPLLARAATHIYLTADPRRVCPSGAVGGFSSPPPIPVALPFARRDFEENFVFSAPSLRIFFCHVLYVQHCIHSLPPVSFSHPPPLCSMVVQCVYS